MIILYEYVDESQPGYTIREEEPEDGTCCWSDGGVAEVTFASMEQANEYQRMTHLLTQIEQQLWFSAQQPAPPLRRALERERSLLDMARRELYLSRRPYHTPWCPRGRGGHHD